MRVSGELKCTCKDGVGVAAGESSRALLMTKTLRQACNNVNEVQTCQCCVCGRRSKRREGVNRLTDVADDIKELQSICVVI